jgi:hypothetical protein
VYSRHGDGDLPTRRHAEESRPVLKNNQGRSMSSVNQASSDPFCRPIVTTESRRLTKLPLRVADCGDNSLRTFHSHRMNHAATGFHR